MHCVRHDQVEVALRSLTHIDGTFLSDLTEEMFDGGGVGHVAVSEDFQRGESGSEGVEACAERGEGRVDLVHVVCLFDDANIGGTL